MLQRSSPTRRAVRQKEKRLMEPNSRTPFVARESASSLPKRGRKGVFCTLLRNLVQNVNTFVSLLRAIPFSLQLNVEISVIF